MAHQGILGDFELSRYVAKRAPRVQAEMPGPIFVGGTSSPLWIFRFRVDGDQSISWSSVLARTNSMVSIWASIVVDGPN